MYVYCQSTLSHFFYASSFGCMRWNKFECNAFTWWSLSEYFHALWSAQMILAYTVETGLKSMSTYVLHMSFRHPTLFCMYICMLCLFGYVWIKDSGSQWLLSPWTELYHLVFLKHLILFGGELLIDGKSKYSSRFFLPVSPTCSFRKLAQRKFPRESSLWRVGHERVLSFVTESWWFFKTPNLSFDKVCESYWLKMWRLFFSWVFHNQDFPMWLCKVSLSWNI